MKFEVVTFLKLLEHTHTHTEANGCREDLSFPSVAFMCAFLKTSVNSFLQVSDNPPTSTRIRVTIMSQEIKTGKNLLFSKHPESHYLKHNGIRLLAATV